MTERYFYTDPLAAAWMAKHFGMRFRPDCYSDRALPEGEDITRFAHPRFGGRFYVHPDSLPLLQPQLGDLISHLGVRAWRIDRVEETTYTHVAFGVERLDRFTFKSDCPQIIQRKRLAFHWPESEPV